MKTISKDIKVKVQQATESVLEINKEVDLCAIKNTLEKEHKIRFFNDSVLGNLIREALDNIVYIYC
ncbi:MAG TPA: hypothetical protein DCW51_10185 [Clostridium sp.]|nr:hypothetical protein [Clostridium sp.]